MATKKAGGSSRNGRDSHGQRRGVKRFGGETINAGTIIVRQVGSKIHAGRNVGIGKDWTLYAKVTGTVKFGHYDKRRKKVEIIPLPVSEAPAPAAAQE